MNKIDFVREIGRRTGFAQADINAVVNAMGEIMREQIARRETLRLLEGLVVSGVVAKETMRTNPKTGERVLVPEHTRPKARFTPNFKNSVK